MSNGISRRNFFKSTGAAAGGLFLAGCEKEDPYALSKPSVPGEESWSAGEEEWVASTCSQCLAGCGILVRVVEGRAVKIEGNPLCPLNSGALGPKGQSGVHLLYHPDRVREPLRRVGPRGSGRWEPISWSQAIKEIGAELHQLRQSGAASGLVVLDGEARGMMPQLWKRFLEAYGSPNHINHRSTTDGAKVQAMSYMQGVAELPAYDWQRVSYILGFGSTLLESSCQTIHFMRAASHLHGGTPGWRGKFVQISPFFSMTAAKADEWVSLEPGTYGALALGLAHILVREERYDQAFIQEHTLGFEDWTDAEGHKHRGFRDIVKEYPPKKVAEITGVPAETIERLAREIATYQPAVVLADDAASASGNGLGTAMAIHALNALLGNLERPGGVLTQRSAPLAPWAPVQHDDLARTNLSAARLDGAGTVACPLGEGFIQGLPEAILSGKPYPAKALFLYRSNPVFSKPDASAWVQAMRQVPLVVSFSPLRDESTFWADFILPDHTYLERWEIVEPVPSVGYPVFGLRQPAVVPLYQTMATGDVVIRLAQAIGSPVSDALPWSDYRAATIERLQGVLEARTGSIVASQMPELISQLEQQGGWWESDYPFEEWETAFRTPSGKFEFYSQEIARRLAEVFPDPGEREKHLAAVGVTARGDELCLPHWQPPRFNGEADEYPFILLAYRSIGYAEGGMRHLPLLRELPEAGHGGGWKESIELNPTDASRLGIGEGDRVWVESPVGKRRLTVKLLSGTRPGTLGLHLGGGPWPPNLSEAQSGSAYSLLVNASDPLAGTLALHGTRVRIRKES